MFLYGHSGHCLEYVLQRVPSQVTIGTFQQEPKATKTPAITSFRSVLWSFPLDGHASRQGLGATDLQPDGISIAPADRCLSCGCSLGP